MANKYKDMDELRRRTDTYELRNEGVLKEMLVILRKQQAETDELIKVITHKLSLKDDERGVEDTTYDT